ncbi:hypothetical protein JQ557_00155 [Bradyrhizobium sp. U87765 SZCCT0131]|uniref:hypothetical protein n=1 Tax=unclassified Bradyrhizobium TaxID=2631580 RepID=UPI001BA9EA33|nr:MULTISPECIES: hypothetical protein [unclassified Bradyrhizobium]MBR1216384.1 hypothetical protein [Bradyrhizobium sp. U87765 SZCCT0131]MBR1259868.1 hypothetical protein [Bradyrhizobium sp. U87765 SZCCT0134]MBR1306001.1 hypothetical protein [Bradyrhizobium sp. U87765 SZCCT0110]MBR1322368.1 hypothetical protein [Bradyrhizobium sp. U87765 SZCCT0109]MBR1352341.1 hypothetical protein [Bradyrhizobium sp. U87765 SZCCT0048]
MSAEKVARLLTHFDQVEPPKGVSRVVPFDQAQHSGAALRAPPKPQVVSQAEPALPEADDPYERGKAEGYGAAAAAFEQQLADERARLDAQLAEERRKLVDEAATRIAGSITEAGAQFEARVAGVAARVLEPFISTAIQKLAVTTFVEQLSGIVGDAARPVLRVSGPASLLEAVRSKLAARAIPVELRAAPTTEISVIADDVVLESQIKRWGERLRFAALT